MKKEKALYASISRNQDRYTIYYEHEGNSFGIQTEGYSPDVFHGLPKNLPVIRFDKASYEDVANWLNSNYQCYEHEGESTYKWTSLPLAKFLDTLRLFNIPVEKLEEVSL